MNKKKAIQPQYSDNFLAGICCLEESEYHQSRKYFLKAVCESSPSDDHYFIYASYLELSAVLSDYEDGVLQYCVHASETTLPIEPEIQINLACSEFLKGNRKLGIQAMDKLNDFKFSEKNTKIIQSMYHIIGKRNTDSKGRLKRDNFFRKHFGKLIRKHENSIARRIEELIKSTVKNRYHYHSINVV